MGPVDLNLVKTVAMLCGIHEWIESLPEGYETPLEGEKGITLSGGQKQRVAMARAVYGFPPLIVLDEPTSSLDRAGMEAFLTLLSRLKAQAPCTCIVVTHTPMLLDAMDSGAHGGQGFGIDAKADRSGRDRFFQHRPRTPFSRCETTDWGA